MISGQLSVLNLIKVHHNKISSHVISDVRDASVHYLLNWLLSKLFDK